MVTHTHILADMRLFAFTIDLHENHLFCAQMCWNLDHLYRITAFDVAIAKA